MSITRLYKLRGHQKAVRCVTVSGCGRFIASGSEDLTVKVWDAHTHELKYTCLNQSEHALCIDFSKDGAMIVQGDRCGVVKIWELADRQTPKDNGQHASEGVTAPIEHVLAGHQRPVLGVKFSPNVQMIASASVDEQVIIWSVQTREKLQAFTVGVRMVTVTWSSDSQLVATQGENSNVYIWRVDSAEMVLRLPDYGGSLLNYPRLAFNRESTLLVSISKNLTIWDLQDWSIPCVRSPMPDQGAIDAFALSPDDKFLVSMSLHGMVVLWDLDAGTKVKVLCQIPHLKACAVAWSPSGDFIVCGDGFGEVCVWKVDAKVCCFV